MDEHDIVLEFAAGALAFKRRALDLPEIQRSEDATAYIDDSVDVLLAVFEEGLAAGVPDQRIVEDATAAVLEMAASLHGRGYINAAAMAAVLSALGEMLGSEAITSAALNEPREEPF